MEGESKNVPKGDKKESRLDKLERNLYSRDENVIPQEKRSTIGDNGFNVPTSWGTPTSFNLSVEVMKRANRNSFFNKFLIGSVVFFVGAVAVSSYIFFGGANTISSNNVDIEIVAPTSVSSGDNFSADLTIKNGNKTDLEDVALFVDYPDGAEDPSPPNKVLTHEQINLGSIPTGNSKDYSIRAILFGQKDVVKSFALRVEYKVKGSNATFKKEKTMDVAIGTSPIILTVSYPKEINSGQDLNIKIDVTSNSNVLLKNTIVKVEYPYGFTYKSSNIKPYKSDSVFNVGDLKNGDQKTLNITGVMIGQNMEDRSFRISAGTKSADITKDFDTALSESSITVGIRKSFFDLAINFTGNSVVHQGQSIPLTISWQNTLPDKIIANHIEATLSGNAFDRSNVAVVDGGFYRSLDNTVVWDKNGTKKLAELLPGEDGQVSFSPITFPESAQTRLVKNPHVDVHVVMSGDRSGLDAGPVSSTADLTIKIVSSLNVTAKSYRFAGPFMNSGPVPPKADIETTYTITWTLTNTNNDLKDGVVSATLPAGVAWKGEMSPISERINYNPDNRTVTWNVGNISSGTGFTNSARTVSFKVGLTPSINQVGATPTLVSQTEVSSFDTYAETPLIAGVQLVTTQYSDPSFKAADGIVVK